MSSQSSFLHKVISSLVAFLAPTAAFAYVGPGAGISAIGSVLALLAFILLAIVGFIWYPLKRFFRSRSKKQESDNTEMPDKQDTNKNS